uniref:VWFD domain-containing protein n=1 Tax=Globodera pallida TaxID=36090 RepID=A0A183BI66_GLOPA
MMSVKQGSRLVRTSGPLVGFEWICYTDWLEILQLVKERFPAYRERVENAERMRNQINDIAKHNRGKTHCEPEKECGSCGNEYSCVEATPMTQESACCRKGTWMKCCVTTTTTTTTTTTATTTTTDENLRCKKAFYESHPTEGDKYGGELNQACGRNEQYCYVLNCTTVLPSVDGYIGFKAEWGCSKSKTAFLDEFKKGKGHANSICVSFVGSKYSDNSNHDKNALLPSSNVSTLWCEGGHFWEKRHHGKTITVCSKHEHYCYVLNCTLELSGKVDSWQPEHYVLTQWGCTDKKPAELSLDTKLIAETAAGRILTQTCSRYVGKANVSRTNAGITVPAPESRAFQTLEWAKVMLKGCSKNTCIAVVLDGECFKRLLKKYDDELFNARCVNVEAEEQQVVLADQLAQLHASINRDEQEKDALVSEKDALISEKEALVSEKDVLVLENEQLVLEKEALMSENEQLVSEKDALISEKEALMSENEQLVSEKDTLISENEQLVLENEQLVSEKDALISEKEALMSENEQLVLEKEALMSENEQLVLEKDALEADNVELHGQLHEQRALDDRLQEKVQALADDVQCLQEQLVELNVRCAGFQEEVEVKDGEINKLHTSMEQKEIDFKQLCAVKNQQRDALDVSKSEAKPEAVVQNVRGPALLASKRRSEELDEDGEITFICIVKRSKSSETTPVNAAAAAAPPLNSSKLSETTPVNAAAAAPPLNSLNSATIDQPQMPL